MIKAFKAYGENLKIESWIFWRVRKAKNIQMKLG